MILAHTSVWVEYERATGSFVDRRLRELIASHDLVAVTEPVVMEVVAGARNNEREADLRRLLLRFDLLRFDAAVDFDAAVRIYRACRRVGITPRGMVDCMIASAPPDMGSRYLPSTAITRSAEGRRNQTATCPSW